ncbi:MAG TPA: hypothetical protein VFG09_11205 [Thermodesulfovibrionales bacterium]|nr:hypothetical protein [Thermodesulfovibrionales bacterium]
MEKGMEKGLEFFDSWMKSQREFLEKWITTQKEFMENWTDSMKKLQESFLSLGSSRETGQGKEMYAMYNSWVKTMANSSKLFTDEAVKIQETWKNTVEKQMEMSRQMATNYFDLFRQKTPK